MGTTTVRIAENIHDNLKRLSKQFGEPMQLVMAKALEEYERVQFFKELDIAATKLREDPKAWKEELAERALWDNTLMDGIDDE